MLSLGKLVENRETSLFLRARFPRFASDGEPFSRIGFHFYGDAFETFESDIVMTKVNGLEELPDLLMDHNSVLNAAETNLYKLQLTYKPEKVVTKAKDGPDTFSMPESSRPYQLFKSLIECETPTTLTLYFKPDREGHDAVHAVNGIRARLKYEKDVMPSVEYRNKYGKIVLVIQVLVDQPKLTVSGFNMARSWPRRQRSFNCKGSSIIAFRNNTLLHLNQKPKQIVGDVAILPID